MRNFLLLLSAFFLSSHGFSQIIFEPAYYIDNAGQRIEGQIENVDWQNNPSEIRYRSSENATPVTLGIGEIREFGIGDGLKYVKESVEIDRSSDKISQMSDQRLPDLQMEDLFLKVLVEGKGSLYSYTDGSLRRYFFKTENSGIKQLVYKRYKTPQGEIAHNRNYRQQLLNELSCGESSSKLPGLDYKRSDLVRYFMNYNTCENFEPINFTEGSSKIKFHLSLRPGLDLSSLSIANNRIKGSRTDFDSEMNFRIGLEAEFVLAFNKNKWAILIEPSYRSYSSEEAGLVLDYTSVELGFGVRHYLFFNDTSKMFFNGLYVFDFPMSETLITREPRDPLEIGAGNNLALGAGYTFANRYSMELRYHLNREILPDYFNWRSQYKTVSLVLGWKLL